ncbi:unnamed protein product [Paramecium sonneborni]|uniref:Uncharacterized protein n=1 Tax=Paramecium sonneborni TaxID=65129 RepID=A0A8S1NTF3_9CILI|nr:unnamed protein product [Paramecium sonneborni]
MDNSMPIIRKKRNSTDQTLENGYPIPPMINSERFIANLQKITLMDILVQFIRDSENKSITEILRSIFEIADKNIEVQDKSKGDLRNNNNNYRDYQKFESNDEQNKKYWKHCSDQKNSKQKDFRGNYRDNERRNSNEKSYYSDKYDRNEKYDKYVNNDNEERYNRYNRNNNYDRNDKQDRYDKMNNYERYDKNEKQWKYDKNERNERNDKYNKYDKGDNDQQNKERRQNNENEKETKGINRDWVIKVPEVIIKDDLFQDNQSQAPFLSITSPK